MFRYGLVKFETSGNVGIMRFLGGGWVGVGRGG